MGKEKGSTEAMRRVLIRTSASAASIAGVLFDHGWVWKHVELFIQASSENRPYTRPCCVKHWATKMKDPAPRAVRQHSHNCVMQCDSAGMDRQCVQKAVGAQKSEGGQRSFPEEVTLTCVLTCDTPLTERNLWGLDCRT